MHEYKLYYTFYIKDVNIYNGGDILYSSWQMKTFMSIINLYIVYSFSHL